MFVAKSVDWLNHKFLGVFESTNKTVFELYITRQEDNVSYQANLKTPDTIIYGLDPVEAIFRYITPYVGSTHEAIDVMMYSKGWPETLYSVSVFLSLKYRLPL